MDVEITFRMETENLPRDIEVSDEYWIIEFRVKGEDEVLGWATIKKKATVDEGIIDYIEVVEEYRRKGIAKRLVDRILEKWPRILVSDGFTDQGKAFVKTIPPHRVMRLP